MTKTWSFTDEFKREAVKLVKQPGAKFTHIARDLGITQRSQALDGPGSRWGPDMRSPAGPFEVMRLAKSSGCSVNCAESRWSAIS